MKRAKLHALPKQRNPVARSPLLAKGGVIVFDDYSSYSGCRRAVDEWLQREPAFRPLFHRRSLGVQRQG